MTATMQAGATSSINSAGAQTQCGTDEALARTIGNHTQAIDSLMALEAKLFGDPMPELDKSAGAAPLPHAVQWKANHAQQQSDIIAGRLAAILARV